MSLKLSIFIFGLFAVSIQGDGSPAATVLQQALAEGAPEFPLALKASGVIFKEMALDALAEKEVNAIVPIWKSIVMTLTNKKGAETFSKIIDKIKGIIDDDNAQRTLLSIFSSVYTCLTYDVGKGGVQFPWKELRKVVFGPNLRVFGMIKERIWRMALNPETKEQFKIIVNAGEETFDEAEEQALSKPARRSRSGYRKVSRDVDGFSEGNLNSMNFIGAGDGPAVKFTS